MDQPPKAQQSVLPPPYVVIQKLGSGAYGTTYLARNEETQAQYAIKKLPRSRVKREDFFREVGALRTMKSRCVPYVLCYQNAIIKNDAYYLLTEFLEGYTPLSDVIADVAKNELTESDRLWLRDVSERLVRGLAVIHEAGVAHRDIKPDNILVAPSGAIKYIDFGLACTQATCKNEGAGTVMYMAPEIYLWKSDGTLAAWQRSDLWSLGATLLELATGIPLFTDFATRRGDEYHPLFGGTYKRKYMELFLDGITMGEDYSTPEDPVIADIVANLLVSDPTSRRLTGSGFDA